jgi:MFS family permease
LHRRFNDTFAALRIAPFRILWTGTVLAFIGFFMSTVVQSVVAFNLTHANSAVGLVIFGQGLTMFTLGPLGGAVADRLPKKRVIAVTQLAPTISYFAIAWAIWSGHISVAWLFGGSLVMGASFAFLGPARQSLAVELVGHELRGNAVALTQVANTGCRVLGPALGGAFLAWSKHGAWLAYIAMGLFYLASSISVLFLPRSEVRPEARERHVLADMLDGLRYVRDHARLRYLVLFYTLIIVFGFPHATILPGLVEHALGRPSESASVLFGFTAFGALLASLLVAAVADSQRAVAIFPKLGLGFGLALLAVAAIPRFGAVTATMVAVGLFSGGFQTLGGALIVRETEPRYVGRVMSLTMLSFAGFGLMGLPIGALADAVGERAAFAILGVLLCVVVAVVRRR